jgi:hypothetical protein
VLLAFINPSGPTREPQEVSVLVGDTFSFLPLSIRWKPPSLVGGIGCARHLASGL